jgi:hypothetical protein
VNQFTKDKPTSQQLVDLIDDEQDITICRDVVNGLDYEYKQLQQERDKYKSIVEKAIEYIEETQLNGNKISEMLCGSEIVKLLEILKELEEGNSNDK